MKTEFNSKGKVLIILVGLVLLGLGVFGLISMGFGRIYFALPFIILLLISVFVFAYFFVVLFPKDPILLLGRNNLTYRALFGKKQINYSDIKKVSKVYQKNDESKNINVIKIKLDNKFKTFNINVSFIDCDAEELFVYLYNISIGTFTTEQVEEFEEKEELKTKNKKLVRYGFVSVSFLIVIVVGFLYFTAFSRTMNRMDNLASLTITIGSESVLINGNEMVFLFSERDPLYCYIDSDDNFNCLVENNGAYTSSEEPGSTYSSEQFNLGFNTFSDFNDWDCDKDGDKYTCRDENDLVDIVITIKDKYVTSLMTIISSPYMLPSRIEITFSGFNDTNFIFPEYD